MKLRVKDFPQYYRDNRSGGIVHDDEAEYAEYKTKKMAQKRQQEEKVALTNRLNTLETEVSNLKAGINEIINLIKNGTQTTTTKDS